MKSNKTDDSGEWAIRDGDSGEVIRLKCKIISLLFQLHGKRECLEATNKLCEQLLGVIERAPS